MSGTLRLRGATSGYSELQAPAVAADQTFVLPTAGGTLLTTDSPIAELTLQLGSASAPSLRFEGDTDTGLYSSGANTLNLVTGGSNRLNIDSLGRVGIGTTSPLSGCKLTVAGNGLAITGQNGAHSANSLRLGEEGSGLAQFRAYGPDASSNGSFQFTCSTSDGTGTGEVMRINSSGSLLVGTSTTSSFPDRLISAGDHTRSSSFIDIRSATVGALLFADGTSGDAAYRGQVEYHHPTDSMRLLTSAVERMRIDSSGNVGIGTSDPDDVGNFSRALDISGASGGSVVIRNNNSATNCGLFAYFGTSTYVMNRAAGPVLFYTNNTVKMELDSSGKVGIGCTPVRDLQLHTSDSSSELMLSNSTTGATAGSGFMIQLDGNDTYIWNKENSFMSFATNAVERMRIDSSGNVGIGTSSPSDKLTVSGHINLPDVNSYIKGNGHSVLQVDTTRTYFYGGSDGVQLRKADNSAEIVTIDNNGLTTFKNTVNIEFNSSQFTGLQLKNASTGTAVRVFSGSSIVGSITNTASATAYNTSSDYRLKENVVDITGAITRVKQLSPKRFNFIADAGITVDGFLAHEAQAVVPEAVTGEKDGDEMQGIDQAKLVPLLTAALQEAIAKIETLETKVAALEAN